MRLPRNALVDSFVYEEYKGQEKINGYQQDSYKPPVTIERVRIDRSTVWTRGSKEDLLQADGVIYTDSVWTTPVSEFVERSKVTYDGKERVINKIIPKTHITSNKLIGYELEVV